MLMPLSRPVSSADLRTDNGALPPAPSPGGHHGEPTSGRVALKIGLERQCYVAGQQIRGVLEVHAKAKGLALGDIGIEFGGTEELRSRDHTSTRRLLTTRLDFQGNGLPPSNAVVPNSRPVQAGFYPALPGRTRFAFVFEIPAGVPSSCTLGANAQKRYELRAFASSLSEGNVDIRTERTEVKVAERWTDWRDGPWQHGLEKRAAEKLAVGGDDLLEMSVSVGRGDHVEKPARLFWRGDPDLELVGKGRIDIDASVRNFTKRHVTGFKVSLMRRLRILYPEDARPLVEPPIVTDTVTSERFQGTEFDVRAECERDVVLSLQVPKEEAWTVRRGSLFELDLVLRMEAECGFLQKSLAVEVPIWIAHPLSLPNSAHRFAANERLRLAPPASEPELATPVHAAPNMQPPVPFADVSHAPSGASMHLPLPGTPLPPSPMSGYTPSTVSMTSAASFPAMWPPSSPAPYFPPPPAAPAELCDPLSPAWSTAGPSTSMAHFSPLQTVAATIAPYHAPASPAYYPTEPSPVPSPSWDANGHPASFAFPAPPSRETHQSPQHASSPHDVPSAPSQYAPIEGGGEALYSPPLPCPSPIPTHRPEPSTTPTMSPPPPPVRARTPLRTPPPTAPSAAYRPHPSRSPSPSEPVVDRTADASLSLETIGEDGESQAGTAKSAMLSTGTTAALRALPADAETSPSPQPDRSPSSRSVQDLEDNVENADRERDAVKEKAPASAARAAAEPEAQEKALPSVPQERLRAQDIFANPAISNTATASPAPASPSMPTSPARLSSPSPPKREPGGLAALQARLARSSPRSAPTSPTPPSPVVPRSPSPTKSMLGAGSGAASAPRARSISRSGRSRQTSTSSGTEDPRVVVQRIRAQSGLTPVDLAELGRPSSSSGLSSPVDLSSPTCASRSPVSPLEEIPTSEVPAAEPAATTAPATPGPPASPRRALPPVPSGSFKGDRVASPRSPQKAASSPSTEVDATRCADSPAPASESVVVSSSSSSESRTESVSAKTPATSAEVLPAVNPEPKKRVSASPWSRQAPSPWSMRSAREPVAAEARTIEPARVPSPKASLADQPVDDAGRKVVDARELRGLRREAVGRVNGWLSGEVSAPAESPQPVPVEDPISRRAQSAPSEDASTTTSRSPSRAPNEPTVAQLLAAETRAAMRKSQQEQRTALASVSSVQQGLNGYLAALEHDASFERETSAHKSAKATKPGKVRNVASIWAGRVEEAGGHSASPPRPGHKSTQSLSSLSSRENAPVQQLTQGRATKDPLTRARPVSLCTSPGESRSPSAKHFLNTTLGRASPTTTGAAAGPAATVRTPPPAVGSGGSPHARTSSPASSPRKGGARVTDLLARYQQQIA